MIKLLPIIFFIGCCQHHLLKKDYKTLTQSPCLDGTILNMDDAGCEIFYWGVIPDEALLKVRCTYGTEDNWWTRMAFYGVSHQQDLTVGDEFLYCRDRYIKMYAVPVDIRVKIEK